MLYFQTAYQGFDVTKKENFRRTLQCLFFCSFISLPVAALSAEPAKLIASTPIQYPEEARRLGEQGQVVVRASLDAAGAVTTVDIFRSSGSRILNNAALLTVRNWQFSPALNNGIPTPSSLLVPITFQFDDHDKKTTPADGIARATEAIQIIQKNHLKTVSTDQLIDGCEKRLVRTNPASNATAFVTASAPIEKEIFAKIQRIFEQNQHSASEGIPQSNLFDECIRGALEAIDPNSTFENKDEVVRLGRPRSDTASIGIGFSIEPGTGLKIDEVIPGGPAERSGLQANDLIKTINGVPTTIAPMTTLLQRLIGAEGSSIDLTVQSGLDQRTTNITRENIPPIKRQAAARVYQKRIGDVIYVRVPNMQLPTPPDVAKAMKTALASNQKAATGIIIDLRGNRGGELHNTAALSAIFMNDQALVASVKSRVQDNNFPIYASKAYAISSTAADFLNEIPKEAKNIPLVVLTNRRTSSGAEIVAASIQTNGRGKIIGETTAGLGLTQTAFRLKDGSRLMFTTASLIKANGEALEGNGVKPDYPLVDDGSANSEVDFIAKAIITLKNTAVAP